MFIQQIKPNIQNSKHYESCKHQLALCFQTSAAKLHPPMLLWSSLPQSQGGIQLNGAWGCFILDLFTFSYTAYDLVELPYCICKQCESKISPSSRTNVWLAAIKHLGKTHSFLTNKKDGSSFTNEKSIKNTNWELSSVSICFPYKLLTTSQQFNHTQLRTVIKRLEPPPASHGENLMPSNKTTNRIWVNTG